jgi:hypothetical protein
MLLHPADRRSDRLLVRRLHLSADVGAAEGPQQGHRLHRREHQVVAGHRPPLTARLGRGEPLVLDRGRWTAMLLLEHPGRRRDPLHPRRQRPVRRIAGTEPGRGLDDTRLEHRVPVRVRAVPRTRPASGPATPDHPPPPDCRRRRPTTPRAGSLGPCSSRLTTAPQPAARPSTRPAGSGTCTRPPRSACGPSSPGRHPTGGHESCVPECVPNTPGTRGRHGMRHNEQETNAEVRPHIGELAETLGLGSSQLITLRSQVQILPPLQSAEAHQRRFSERAGGRLCCLSGPNVSRMSADAAARSVICEGPCGAL